MENATENARLPQSQAGSTACRLLQKFVRVRKECPDNRSTLGLRERIRGGRMQACVRLVCCEAWPYGGKICTWQRQ